MRPYPEAGGTWKGQVYAVQCFFGFAKLEEPAESEAAGSRGAFGLYLPDDAIVAVRMWLDTVRFMKTAQASSFETLLTYLVKSSGSCVKRLSTELFTHCKIMIKN